MAFPRSQGEKALPYARRLHLASQQGHRAALVNGQPLTLAQLTSLSGAKESHLREDPQLRTLPPELAPVRAAFPRSERESASAYARRLNRASQQGHREALVNGQPLTLPQLSSLSGAKESHLQQDPQLQDLPLELAPVRAAFPRREREAANVYARRLNEASQQGHRDALINGQPLTVGQLASLAGATVSTLQQDSQLKALPPELAPVRAAFPRSEREKMLPYARRLNLASQQGHRDALVNGEPLTLPQLALLSGAKESILRCDSQIKPLPLELSGVRAAFPREEGEPASTYARRLNEASQQGRAGALVNGQPLTLSQLASLSGATVSDLRQDTQLEALPPELAQVRAAFPRGERENALPYARRLNLAIRQGHLDSLLNGQTLPLSQLAILSGTSEFHLREDPQLKPLPLELTPVRAAFPRSEREKALPYARRLNLASQREHAGALVNGQRLTLAQLATLSGVTEAELRQDPQLKPLPLELVPVRQAFPFGDGESASAYARRLNLASQQGHDGAVVNGQTLTLSQLASLSGIKEAILRQDVQLQALPLELAPVRAAFPRGKGEPAVVYARRLNTASQQGHRNALVNGQPLTFSQLASLSGAKQSILRQDPQLRTLPLELEPVREAFPRGERENGLSYARRLNLASQRRRAGALVSGQPLTLSQLASLAGVTESHLRHDSLLQGNGGLPL